MIRFSLPTDVFPTQDPWATLAESSARLRRVGETLQALSSDQRHSAATAIPLDVYATDDRGVILAALPGVHPEDLDLTVHGNTVTLSGQFRHGPARDNDGDTHATWYVSEIGRGAFRRTVTLPFEIAEDNVDAQFANGMLRLTLPKVEAAKPRKIAVKLMTTPSPELSASVEESSSQEMHAD